MQLLISSSLARLLSNILMQTSIYFLKNSVSISFFSQRAPKFNFSVSFMRMMQLFWFYSAGLDSSKLSFLVLFFPLSRFIVYSIKSPWLDFCFFKVVAEMKYRHRNMTILNESLRVETLAYSLKSRCLNIFSVIKRTVEESSFKIDSLLDSMLSPKHLDHS